MTYLSPRPRLVCVLTAELWEYVTPQGKADFADVIKDLETRKLFPAVWLSPV